MKRIWKERISQAHYYQGLAEQDPSNELLGLLHDNAVEEQTNAYVAWRDKYRRETQHIIDNNTQLYELCRMRLEDYTGHAIRGEELHARRLEAHLVSLIE